MVFKHVWIFPALATLFAFLAFFIGDGGALPPESCIFGEFLNLSAMFVAITVYLRHLQIVVFYDKIHHVGGHWRMWSTCMMLLGFVIAIGATLVANVQETSIPVLHAIGAFLAFICGVIYLWAQLIFGFIMKPTITQKYITAVRVLCAVLTTVGLVFYIVVQFAKPFVPRDANGALPTKPPKIDGIIRPPPDSPYYANHVVATVSEWVLGMCLYFFVLSYAFELRYTSTHAPKLILKPNHKNVNKVYAILDTPIAAFPRNDLPNTSNNPINQEKSPNRYGNNEQRNEYYY